MVRIFVDFIILNVLLKFLLALWIMMVWWIVIPLYKVSFRTSWKEAWEDYWSLLEDL